MLAPHVLLTKLTQEGGELSFSVKHVLYFLWTGSNTETPATAMPIAPTTTPPATTDSKRFFKEGETPGCAASAISGMMAAARRATEVGVFKFCSFFSALITTLLHFRESCVALKEGCALLTREAFSATSVATGETTAEQLTAAIVSNVVPERRL
eukprot:TRINITY_DN121_c0_g1_i1.p1 TRINITY_DN121_c0_g1~~TRINITY_DN121_c0_g1_i1.p1  ORF type:complete len:154 (-),score=35.14 TRINITY_DN121_c0_g1_i1:46-507(-)